MGNIHNRVYVWFCKYGKNRYCERCANKKLCASKHTGLLNSCLGKLCLHPYLVVPLISAKVTLISTRVSAHCQAILLERASWQRQCSGVCPISSETMSFYQYIGCEVSRDKRFIGYWNDLQGHFLLTWINFNPTMAPYTQYNVGWNYLSIPKVAPLKFWHGWVISSHTS